MSDVMLLGVLRMPPELWRDDPIDVMQRYGRYKQAADEIERLRDDISMVYQVIGAAMLGEPVDYDQQDVVRVLDNLSAAAHGEPRPHEDLLPWPRRVEG